MHVSYEFPFSHTASLVASGIAEDLEPDATDDDIDTAVADALLAYLIDQGMLPSPKIHGRGEIREAVRKAIAERVAEEE